MSEGIPEILGTSYSFTRDYVLESASAAASVVLGAGMNGLTNWKDAEGRTLKELRASPLE